MVQWVKIAFSCGSCLVKIFKDIFMHISIIVFSLAWTYSLKVLIELCASLVCVITVKSTGQHTKSLNGADAKEKQKLRMQS